MASSNVSRVIRGRLDFDTQAHCRIHVKFDWRLNSTRGFLQLRTLQKKKVPEAGQRHRNTVLNSSLHTSDGLQLTVWKEREEEKGLENRSKNIPFILKRIILLRWVPRTCFFSDVAMQEGNAIHIRKASSCSSSTWSMFQIDNRDYRWVDPQKRDSIQNWFFTVNNRFHFTSYWNKIAKKNWFSIPSSSLMDPALI